MADGDKYKVTLSSKLYKGTEEVEASAMDLSWSDMEYDDVVKLQEVLPKLFEMLNALGKDKSKEKKEKRK
jgi:hypothetical protein